MFGRRAAFGELAMAGQRDHEEGREVRQEEGPVVRWVETAGGPAERYFVSMRVLPGEWRRARAA